MAITFEVPPSVHNGPQLARLRRSPSRHPRAILTKPKSGMSKAVEAVKNHFKISHGAIKYWLRYRSRHSDIFPWRYPVRQQNPLKTSRVADKETCYEIRLVLKMEEEEDDKDDEPKTSSMSEEDDTPYDSRVVLPEATKVKSQLQVVMKDGRVCAWWMA